MGFEKKTLATFLKNYTGLKLFKAKKNLNHNLYMYICTLYFIEN